MLTVLLPCTQSPKSLPALGGALRGAPGEGYMSLQRRDPRTTMCGLCPRAIRAQKNVMTQEADVSITCSTTMSLKHADRVSIRRTSRKTRHAKTKAASEALRYQTSELVDDRNNNEHCETDILRPRIPTEMQKRSSVVTWA